MTVIQENDNQMLDTKISVDFGKTCIVVKEADFKQAEKLLELLNFGIDGFDVAPNFTIQLEDENDRVIISGNLTEACNFLANVNAITNKTKDELLENIEQVKCKPRTFKPVVNGLCGSKEDLSPKQGSITYQKISLR